MTDIAAPLLQPSSSHDQAERDEKIEGRGDRVAAGRTVRQGAAEANGEALSYWSLETGNWT